MKQWSVFSEMVGIQEKIMDSKDGWNLALLAPEVNAHLSCEGDVVEVDLKSLLRLTTSKIMVALSPSLFVLSASLLCEVSTRNRISFGPIAYFEPRL